MGDRVVSFEIGCKDLEATSNFYEQVFGWSTSDYGPNGRRIETGAKDSLNGHFVALEEWPTALNFYIEVDDVAAKIDAVVQAGGEAVLGPFPTPDGQLFAWVRDVAGNIIGLLQRSQANGA